MPVQARVALVVVLARHLQVARRGDAGGLVHLARKDPQVGVAAGAGDAADVALEVGVVDPVEPEERRPQPNTADIGR